MPVWIDDKHLVGANAALLLPERHAKTAQMLAEVLQAVDHPGGMARPRRWLRLRAWDVLRIGFDDVKFDALVFGANPVARPDVRARQDFETENLRVELQRYLGVFDWKSLVQGSAQSRRGPRRPLHNARLLGRHVPSVMHLAPAGAHAANRAQQLFLLGRPLLLVGARLLRLRGLRVWRLLIRNRRTHRAPASS